MNIKSLIPKVKPIPIEKVIGSDDILLWERFYNHDFATELRTAHNEVDPFTNYGYLKSDPDSLVPLHYPEYLESITLVQARGEINKDDIIVDVGCGIGKYLVYLYKLGYRNLYGIDCSRDILRIAEQLAKERKAKINWIWGMAQNLSEYFAEGSVKVVRCSDLLEHLPDSELFFDQVKKVIKKRGSFYSILPIEVDVKRKIGGHIKQYTIAELDKQLSRRFSQVTIIRVRNYCNRGAEKFFVSTWGKRHKKSDYFEAQIKGTEFVKEDESGIDRKFYEIAREWMPNLSDKKILDLGCNTGYELAYWNKQFNNVEVYGIDLYFDALRFGKEKYSFNAIEADIHNLPFRSGIFDFIHAREILEHSYDPERMMGEIKRVLKIGGLLFGWMPILLAKSKTHLWQIRPRELDGFLLSFGFKILKWNIFKYKDLVPSWDFSQPQGIRFLVRRDR